MNKTKKLVFISLMIAYSLILYIIESFLPSLHFIAPGSKLGLTNVVLLVALYIFGIETAFVVLVVRVVMTSIFGGGFYSFSYSIFGGVFAIISMWVVKSLNIKSVSEIGVSVVGAEFFNIGQLLVAAFMIKNKGIFVYLPVMTYMSIGTGIFVGVCAKFVIQRMKKNKDTKNFTI